MRLAKSAWTEAFGKGPMVYNTFRAVTFRRRGRMTKHKGQPRKLNRVVRRPATRLAHLQKRMRQRLDRTPPRVPP